MLEWPGRCGRCGEEIADWADAGFWDRRWLHKSCYADAWSEAKARGMELEELRSPAERGKVLEWPLFAFLMMFHFGLGGAVAGWIMLDQDKSPGIATILLAIGIIIPLIGLAGVAVNIISRRRIESIRQTLDLAGGWRPGR